MFEYKNNPQPEQPKHNWFSHHHMLGYAFLFAVFAAIVSLVYYIQVANAPIVMPPPPPAINSDWKTYTNTEYGFELKLPNDWQVTTFGNGISFVAATTAAFIKENQENCENLETNKSLICITEGPGSDLEFSNASNLEPEFEKKYNLKIEHQTINNIDFKAFPILGMYTGYFYETENNGKVYSFNITDSSQATIARQILSTFKFTN